MARTMSLRLPGAAIKVQVHLSRTRYAVSDRTLYEEEGVSAGGT